jgi:hypothetical protein
MTADKRLTIQSLNNKMSELIVDGFHDFAAFCAENWTMTEAEAECLTVPTDAPSEYARGYTDAMKIGLPDAMELWLEEGQYQ